MANAGFISSTVVATVRSTLTGVLCVQMKRVVECSHRLLQIPRRMDDNGRRHEGLERTGAWKPKGKGEEEKDVWSVAVLGK